MTRNMGGEPVLFLIQRIGELSHLLRLIKKSLGLFGLLRISGIMGMGVLYGVQPDKSVSFNAKEFLRPDGSFRGDESCV